MTNLKSKIYALLMALVIMGVSVDTWAKTLIISNYTDLQNLAREVESNTFGSGDIAYLTADITTPVSFMIGTFAKPFKGSFIGLGSGTAITLNIQDLSSNVVGLFGRTLGATIENIKVTGTVKGCNYVGGIVGNADTNTTIKNCENTASITIKTGLKAGGIAGGATRSTIINCRNAGNLGYEGSPGYLSGIVGSCDANVSISLCTNTGTITGYHFASGITSDLGPGSSITDCFNSGTITAMNNYAGGIVAVYRGGSITRAVNASNIRVAVAGYTEYGAIIGHDISNSSLSGISNCHYDKTKATVWHSKLLGVNTRQNTAGSGTDLASTKAWLTSASMKGTALMGSAYLGPNNAPWIFDPNRYPRLGNSTIETNASLSKINISLAANSSAFGTFSASEVIPSIVKEEASVTVNTVEEGYLNVAIYDVTGQKIMDLSNEFVDANKEVKLSMNNLSSLASGMYMVVVSQGSDKVMRKFMKQ